MSTLGAALLIFILRIADVAIGTMRVMYVVRGQRLMAGTLALLESLIFIFAISRVFQNLNTAKMLGYAAGFGVGTLVGITIENWIASGFILVRIISREKSAQMRDRLRECGFGVTVVHGEGREGNVMILFIVAPRRRGKEILPLINQVDDSAFVTIESINRAIGGYIPHVATKIEGP